MIAPFAPVSTVRSALPWAPTKVLLTFPPSGSASIDGRSPDVSRQLVSSSTRPKTNDQRPRRNNQVSHLAFVFRRSSFVFGLTIRFGPAAGVKRLLDRHQGQTQRAAAFDTQICLAVAADHIDANQRHVILER